ncbi:MAG TPA: hypothetical protein VFJ16_29545 [Longimicrobium sp.]|nr:hypothetical protein [Longimicrobium sp.]
MSTDALLSGIDDPGLRSQFRRFIESGDATEEFLDMLDASPEYQKIVDAAFEAQAARLERFAANLHELEPASAGASASQAGNLSSRLAWTVKQAAKLPADALERLAEQTARAVPPDQRPHVNSVVAKLSEALGR